MTWTTWTQDGRWFAARSTAPYFCFEGSSESEANAMAERALAFFAKLTPGNK